MHNSTFFLLGNTYINQIASIPCYKSEFSTNGMIKSRSIHKFLYTIDVLNIQISVNYETL